MGNPPVNRKRRFSDSHVPPNLRRQVVDILNATAQSLAAQPILALPALMLIYAGIDGMAYVALPETQPDVQGPDFYAWVNKYFLRDSELPCTAEDLYAARCGVVHDHQVDSRLARQGKARHVWYYIGPPGMCLIPFHQQPHVAPVVVPLARLANAFHRAVDRFFDAIESDPELEQRVWSRANKYFEEVISHGEPMTEGSWVETIPPDFGWEDEE